MLRSSDFSAYGDGRGEVLRREVDFATVLVVVQSQPAFAAISASPPQSRRIRRPAGRLRAGPNPALAIRPLPASCRRVRPRRATSSGNSRSERLNAGCPAALPLRPDQAEGDAVVFLASDRRGTRVRHVTAPSTSSGPSEPSPGLTVRAADARCHPVLQVTTLPAGGVAAPNSRTAWGCDSCNGRLGLRFRLHGRGSRREVDASASLSHIRVNHWKQSHKCASCKRRVGRSFSLI